MGWIQQLLHKLGFKLDEKPQLERVHLYDLKDWLHMRSQEIIDGHKLDHEGVLYRKKIKDKRWLIECKIDDWEKRVHNLKNDQERENVHRFFSASRRAMEHITFQEKTDLEKILQINRVLARDIELILEKIGASFFSQNFHFMLPEDERKLNITINPLLKELLELDALREEFENKIVQTGLRTIKALHEKRVQLESIHNKVKNLHTKSTEKRERLKFTEKRKSDKEKDLTVLRNDNTYAEIGQAKEKEKRVKNRVQEQHEILTSIFSKLNLALKQYQNNQPSNKVVNSYLNDPIKAFEEDEGLSIIHVLQHLKALLQSGKIFLEPDQINSSLEILKKYDTHFFEQLQSKSLNIQKERISSSSLQIEDKGFFEKLEEADYRHDHFSKQVNKLRQECLRLDNEFHRAEEISQRDKELFQKMVKVGLGRELVIKA
jgi:hypothetical protein